jgi:hypothetical protein
VSIWTSLTFAPVREVDRVAVRDVVDAAEATYRD